MITEKDAWFINGYLAIVILFVLCFVAIYSFISDQIVMGVIFAIVAIILSTGFTIIQPNQAVIVQFVGKYVGTYRQEGIVMFIPFSKRKRVSLREQVFQSKERIVHDVTGEPITMSMVVLYKIVDAAKAVFDVENLDAYIEVQSEMSIRNQMAAYPYESLLTDEPLLQKVTKELKQDMYDRLHRTGIDLTEIRLIPAILPEKVIELNNGDKQIHEEKMDESRQLTERILQLMERENIISLDNEKNQ